MPTLAILEDSPSAFAQMQSALAQDPTLTLLYHSPLGAQMKTWLKDNAVDVLVVDLNLPDISGLEVIAHCRAVRPKTEMLVCTLFEDDDHVFTSLRTGAGGYLLKADIREKLSASVHQLLEGGAPMSPSIARKVLRQFQARQNVAAPSLPLPEQADGLLNDSLDDSQDDSHDDLLDDSLDHLERLDGKDRTALLTSKQIAVLNLVARGFKYTEVAQFLDLSIHTVHSQLKAVYKKLEVSSRAEAVYEARQLKLLG